MYNIAFKKHSTFSLSDRRDLLLKLQTFNSELRLHIPVFSYNS